MATLIQNLLLELISAQANRPSAAQLAALSPHQFEALLQLAEQQDVTPLLYAKLKVKGMETAVSLPVLNTLRHNYQLNTVRNKSIYRELKQLADALQAASIPTIVLKGGFLADAVYGAIGERVVGDLDLLVPKEAMPQVITISEYFGYVPTKPVVLDMILDQRHHIPPFTNSAIPLEIEWHWHIVRPTPHAFPVTELWQRAIPTTIAGIEALMLSPEDLLLHIADHLSYHHEFSFGMRSLCDIAAICERYRDTIQWDVFVNRANQWQWERGVFLALQLAKNKLGAVVPPDVLTQLRPDDFVDELLETAVSQLFTNPIEFQYIPTALRNLEKAQGITDKLNIIRHSLFPSPALMVERYGIAPGSMNWIQLHLFRWGDLWQQTMRNLVHQRHNKEEIMPIIKRRNKLSTWMAMEK